MLISRSSIGWFLLFPLLSICLFPLNPSPLFLLSSRLAPPFLSHRLSRDSCCEALWFFPTLAIWRHFICILCCSSVIWSPLSFVQNILKSPHTHSDLWPLGTQSAIPSASHPSFPFPPTPPTLVLDPRICYLFSGIHPDSPLYQCVFECLRACVPLYVFLLAGHMNLIIYQPQPTQTLMSSKETKSCIVSLVEGSNMKVSPEGGP